MTTDLIVCRRRGTDQSCGWGLTNGHSAKPIPSSMFLSPCCTHILDQSAPICNLCSLQLPNSWPMVPCSHPSPPHCPAVPSHLSVYNVLNGVAPLTPVSDGWWLWKLKEAGTGAIAQERNKHFVKRLCLRKKTADFLMETQRKFKTRPLYFSPL